MYKPGDKGDGKKRSHTYIGSERGGRSDRALVLTLGPLSAHSCLGTLVGIPIPLQKMQPSTAFMFVRLKKLYMSSIEPSVTINVVQLYTSGVIQGMYMH